MVRSSNRLRVIPYLFSKNTRPEVKRVIKKILGIKELKNGAIYFGNSFIMGRQKIKEFRRIKDRVQAKVKEWQSQLLSRAGKATLIKAVA